MKANLQNYEAFCLVANESSFTSAAASMGYSQSAVSRMVADLEQECGAALFERSRAGVQITAAGTALLPAARAVVAAHRDFASRADELRGLSSGLIRIGTFSSVATHWLPKIIAAFQADYPGIDYELLLGDYAEIEEALATGRVDCAFSRLPAHGPFNAEPLAEDELLAILPEGHPLARQASVSPEQLAHEPYIRLARGENDEAADVFAALPNPPAAHFTTWDDYAVMSMVESGLGVSILPSLIMRRAPYQVVERPLEPRAYRTIGFLTRKTATPTLAVERFREYLDRRDEQPSNRHV